MSRFLSTLSLRRATVVGPSRGMTCKDFYPRSPCGERPSLSCFASFPRSYFYPRSPCGERLDRRDTMAQELAISIHALLAESDGVDGSGSVATSISIHALLAESDSKPRRLKSRRCVFLSTLSLRRATYVFCEGVFLLKISIHALLAESDRINARYTNRLVAFLSTLSLRRATEENPTQKTETKAFLSTLSLRRATPPAPQRESSIKFLSTLSLRRATVLSQPSKPRRLFLSTLSLRRATARCRC